MCVSRRAGNKDGWKSNYAVSNIQSWSGATPNALSFPSGFSSCSAYYNIIAQPPATSTGAARASTAAATQSPAASTAAATQSPAASTAAAPTQSPVTPTAATAATGSPASPTTATGSQVVQTSTPVVTPFITSTQPAVINGASSQRAGAVGVVVALVASALLVAVL